jgi:predicted enzyme related to lactoylglutathione lyase
LQVWLSGPGTSARKKLKDGQVPVPGGWNRLVIEVKDLDKTLRALQAQGVHLRSKPIQGPGGRQVLVDDPSGNPLELFEARGTI